MSSPSLPPLSRFSRIGGASSDKRGRRRHDMFLIAALPRRRRRHEAEIEFVRPSVRPYGRPRTSSFTASARRSQQRTGGNMQSPFSRIAWHSTLSLPARIVMNTPLCPSSPFSRRTRA